MALSPNYGWSEPDNSSLVKNGAADIRTLGDAIDTSVWNVGFGQAGKNKIINGDFSINQRNLTSITAGGYGFDRWITPTSGATATQSAQTFALGTAPVAGYEGKNFLRMAVSVGNDFCRVAQSIESVRTFAGQTVTLSFWAKGTNPTVAGNLRTRLEQSFGTGGSPSANVSTTEQTFVLTANWTRYSFVFAVPSIAGKTLGTNNDDKLTVDIGQLSNALTDAWTLDLWGVQLEYGSKATPFQTATGTIQGELAACQRYFYRAVNGADNTEEFFSVGQAYSTTATVQILRNPVTMRTNPTLTVSSGSHFQVLTSIYGTVGTTGVAPDKYSPRQTSILMTGASGLTAGNASGARANSASATLDLSAEL